MKGKPLDDNFLFVAQRLKELDGQIPVPFAATAEGMKARLTAPRVKKPHPFGKVAWSLASLVVVAAIGFFSWPHLFGSFSLTDNQSMQAKFAAGQSEAAVAADEFSLQQNLANPFPQTAENSSASISGSGPFEESDANGKMRVATSYEEIQSILSTVPATKSDPSGGDGFSYPAEGGSQLAGASLLNDGTYSYSLDSGADSTYLTIARNSDAVTMSTIAVSYTEATLLLSGDSLILSGQSDGGTQLDFYNISDVSAPVLQRTFTQQGDYLGTWFEGGSLVIGSIYSVSDASALIPNVFDSLQGQSAPVSMPNILLPDTCTQAIYAVVTAIPVNPAASACSYAVLGGYGIRCEMGKVEIATGNTTAVLTAQQGNLCYLSEDEEKTK